MVLAVILIRALVGKRQVLRRQAVASNSHSVAWNR
jgi:hypothetical protein